MSGHNERQGAQVVMKKMSLHWEIPSETKGPESLEAPEGWDGRVTEGGTVWEGL